MYSFHLFSPEGLELFRVQGGTDVVQEELAQVGTHLEVQVGMVRTVVMVRMMVMVIMILSSCRLDCTCRLITNYIYSYLVGQKCNERVG